MTQSAANRSEPMVVYCPFCKAKRRTTVYTVLPRQAVDCKCGATADIKPIIHDCAMAFWSVEWERP